MTNYIKITVFVFALLGLNGVVAQETNNIPPELLGSWLITNVYAEDTTMAVDSAESAALMEDLVHNNAVIYEFSLNTFTLKMNGSIVGTCNYVVDENIRFIFDENGQAFEEIVKDLVGVELTTTELRLKASSPDGESSLTYHEFLTKQP